MTNIVAVVGLQYGSEGKGAVTGHIARAYREGGATQCHVRVAGPNAGHTVVDDDGNRIALRSIPVAAAVDPQADLVVAPGSEIDLEVLASEYAKLESYGHKLRDRLWVDPQATILTDSHKAAESRVDLVGRIGSTGKGIGAARADRIMRTAPLAGDGQFREALERLGARVADTSDLLRSYATSGGVVVIEGTQGYGLGLHAGYYPKCTSSDCRAIDFMAMAGIADPWNYDVSVVGVARTYPIRVAGESGPLAGETTWEELGLAQEHTTVTGKVRRVGEWDPGLVLAAARANGGGWDDDEALFGVFLTMGDYVVPAIAGKSDVDDLEPQAIEDLAALVRRVEQDTLSPVVGVGTGPSTWIDAEFLDA